VDLLRCICFSASVSIVVCLWIIENHEADLHDEDEEGTP
jgi:hypothetical protein